LNFFGFFVVVFFSNIIIYIIINKNIWVGPPQLTGLSSARRRVGLGRSWPNISFFFSFCGSGPTHTFGLGHNRPDPSPLFTHEQWDVNYNSRSLFIQQTKGEEEENDDEEKEEGHLVRWWSGYGLGSAGVSGGVD